MRTLRESIRRRNRLYRSRDGVFFGVCGGIAEHFDFSPWAVRCLVVLLTIPSFFWTVVIYIVLGLVLKTAPIEHFNRYEDEEFWNTYQNSRSEALKKVHRAFSTLDKRLQRMETIVTDRSFGLEDEYKDL